MDGGWRRAGGKGQSAEKRNSTVSLTENLYRCKNNLAESVLIAVTGEGKCMTTLARSNRIFRSTSVSAPAFQMSLRRGDLWRIELGHERLPIRCLSGALWITREGSPTDTLLPAGEACELRGRGLVLVSAVPEAEVRVGSSAS